MKDFNLFGRTVPFTSSCVERHIYNCNREQKDVVIDVLPKLLSRINSHCRQVKCDVCGAKRCLARLDGMWNDDNFCRLDTGSKNKE